MDAVNIATILVALIAAAGAWASQRAASRAAIANTQVSGRLDMENAAYDRARAFDTETIKRQNEEIAELRKEMEIQRQEHMTCTQEAITLKVAHEREIAALRARISRLERGVTSNLEEALRERLREHPELFDDRTDP